MTLVIALRLCLAAGLIMVAAAICWREPRSSRKPMKQAELDAYIRDQTDRHAAENAKHCERLMREQAREAAEQLAKLTANGGGP